MVEITISKKKIGENHPTFIIGEMAWSHDGSVENAKKIIDAVADGGGDAISMHITSLENYMTKDYRAKSGQTISTGKTGPSIYDYLEKINLNEDDWKELFKYAKKRKLINCAMCNDIHSVRFSDELDVDIHVIASSCFDEQDMVSEIAKRKKPIILRVGGATLEEIEEVVHLINDTGNEHIVFLHGIQSYPTAIADTNIRLIHTLKQRFSYPIGSADHVDADIDFALIAPLLAVALGANLIEKHVTYDRGKKGEDFEAALNPKEFKTLVDYVRMTESALGSSTLKPLSSAEIKYREVSRKKTVARIPIKTKDVIKKEMIAFKRSDAGISPKESKRLIGKMAKRDIKKDEGITWDSVM